MVEPNIETVVLAPVKPVEPLPEPKSFELSEHLAVDENALNMRSDLNFTRFKAPKLTVSNNFSYMGLGRRQALGSRAKPSYPREAKNAQVEGTVYLQFDISKLGIPTNITVLESKPQGGGSCGNQGCKEVALRQEIQPWKACRYVKLPQSYQFSFRRNESGEC